MTNAKKWRNALSLVGLSLVTTLACAQQATPKGLWKTIDDGTKKELALVRIEEHDGMLFGKIEKSLEVPEPPPSVCDKCDDERKGKPIIGMTIIRNVKQSQDDANLWDGGDILDPDNGKIYRVRLKPIDNGQKLEVRGYIGVPWAGRSQIWVRAGA